MGATLRLPLAEIEQRVCDVTSQQLCIPRQRISPRSSMMEDLGIDSLDVVELIMTVEEAFAVTLPDDAPNPVYKAVFTRQPFRLSDLAELVYLQQGTGTPERSWWRQTKAAPTAASAAPFTQLEGRWHQSGKQALFEPLRTDGPVRQYRRRSDGMRCVLIPSASVEIGSDGLETPPDEHPKHVVRLDSFVIDAVPVSTTAYCRFLNSIGPVYREVHQDWFVLDPQDDRSEHMLVTLGGAGWQPVSGTERRPMILVSWYGANAYSLWANAKDWSKYRDDLGQEHGSFLPTEAQWEYAARGRRAKPFPWGDSPPAPDRMCYGQHRRHVKYRVETLPMADVNEVLGMSPFGLHHMSGNVWQWCRDWYDATFYQRAEANAANPVNRTPTRVRSERGGSWIGPAELCRSSYRRGRPPSARGRCLGFRCVSSVRDAC
jgi:formylglycine-generating enzyme